MALGWYTWLLPACPTPRLASRLWEPGGDRRVVTQYLSEIIRGTELSRAWAQGGLSGLGVGSWPRVQEREKPTSRWAAASVYNLHFGLHWVWGLQRNRGARGCRLLKSFPGPG